MPETPVTEPETPDATTPPPFIADLVEATELTPEQFEQMRAAGAGWGNIKITVRLAEQIAANREDALTFTDAGWDFVDETDNGTEDIWWILEGRDYPRLWWEMADETPR